MAEIHTVPIHLEAEETFLFNLTARQCFLLGGGIALGSMALNHVPDLLLGFLVAGLFVLAAIVLALVRVAGRPLEAWAIVALVFLVQPPAFLWRFVPEEHDAHELDPTKKEDTSW
jgi:hypothetical protein